MGRVKHTTKKADREVSEKKGSRSKSDGRISKKKKKREAEVSDQGSDNEAPPEEDAEEQNNEESEKEEDDEEDDGNDEDIQAEDEENDEEQEGGSDDDEDEEADDNGDGTKTEEQLEEDKKKRRNAKAKRRGYRHVAGKGGFQSEYSSTDASRDIAANITTVKEVTRACKWAPSIEDKPAFASVAEFEERRMIANEPLTTNAAKVFQASIEVFARKLMYSAVKTTFDKGANRVTPIQMIEHTLPLQRRLKYTFAAPHGLIRYAQTELEGERLDGPKDAKAINKMHTKDLNTINGQKAFVLKQHKSNQLRKKEKEARTIQSAVDKKAKRKAKRMILREAVENNSGD